MSHPQLAELADEYFQWKLMTEPISASLIGIHDYDAEFGEFSRAAEDRHITELRAFASRAAAVDPAELNASDRITRDVLIFETENAADVAETRSAEMAVNHTIGLQAMIPVVVPQLSIETAEHADAFIERFSKSQQAYGEMNDRLAEGVANGRTPMASTAQKTVDQIDGMLAMPVDQDPFMNAQTPAGADEAAWKERLAALVTDHVRPALQSYRDMVAESVVPAGRSDDEPGLCHLPDGEATYARYVKQHTSLPLDPEEIHHLGLRQIDSLAEEYRTLGQEVLGTSDLKEIYTRLRDDPDLHFTTGADVVAASEAAMAKAKAAMGDWFGRLPKADCVVAETPSGPTAFYFPPATDGSRPGTFFVNTEDPTRWGRFEIEAMAYHEGIPGHHLQLAISQELEDVPEFRKHAQVTVYAEGWGLYTERLADEMGLYTGGLERIGMLSADSMRAGRLVVDTGIHAKGWTREQGIQYFLDNSPMSRGTVEGEVDRYIGMPGQALAYMIGRLEIMRMRAEAEAAMGDGFDIRGFHDTVLSSGLVPMETLDRMVKDWVAAS
ncbi:MAG: DUF885 domain-containing protein [bacterium]|nr:DUF885 domain-containing protein [bacterium]